MNTMKKNLNKVLGAAILASSALGITSAHADTGTGYLTSASPVPWTVRSNGQSYTSFKPMAFVGVNGKLQYDVGVAGGIKSWWAQLNVVNGYGIAAQVQGLAAHKLTQSYPLGSRPNTLNKTLNFSIPQGVFESNAVGMCNWLANSLRNQGKSNQQIFSQDREVTFTASLDYGVDASGAGSGNPIWEASSPIDIKVRCAKWTGPQVPTAPGGFVANPQGPTGPNTFKANNPGPKPPTGPTGFKATTQTPPPPTGPNKIKATTQTPPPPTGPNTLKATTQTPPPPSGPANLQAVPQTPPPPSGPTRLKAATDEPETPKRADR